MYYFFVKTTFWDSPWEKAQIREGRHYIGCMVTEREVQTQDGSQNWVVHSSTRPIKGLIWRYRDSTGPPCQRNWSLCYSLSCNNRQRESDVLYRMLTNGYRSDFFWYINFIIYHELLTPNWYGIITGGLGSKLHFVEDLRDSNLAEASSGAATPYR